MPVAYVMGIKGSSNKCRIGFSGKTDAKDRVKAVGPGHGKGHSIYKGEISFPSADYAKAAEALAQALVDCGIKIKRKDGRGMAWIYGCTPDHAYEALQYANEVVMKAHKNAHTKFSKRGC